jgi:hypothetical protein
MKRFRLAGCAAVMALAGLANAQELTISDYVRKLVAERQEAGEELVGDIMIGEIGQDETIDYTFRIDPAKAYVVYGACDDDCTDVDLLASDEDGKAVDEDIEDDDAPVLVIMPGWAGDRLTVSVSMASCETDVCVTGVGLYELATDGPELTIDDYVRERVAAASDAGEVLVGDIMIDAMAAGESREYDFTIDPKKKYWVYGACDTDCGDIDLFASDASGEVINQDIEDDAGPILLIGAGDAGRTLTVSIDMIDCDTDVCVAGVGVYEAIAAR